MKARRSYLMALVLEGKKCLVVGGDDEAAERAWALAETGAMVVVVAESPGPALESLAASGAVTVERRGWGERDLDETWLVVLTERDRSLVERVGLACRARRILFCGVDQPGENSANHVGVARAGPLSVAISSDGRAPALTKRLREELERVMADAELGAFAEHVAKVRDRTPSPERREKLSRMVADLRLGPWHVPSPTDE